MSEIAKETTGEMTPLTDEELKDWLKPVLDPDVGVSIVDMGLIYQCHMDGNGFVEVTMTLTTPMCPAGDQLSAEIKSRLKEIPLVTDSKVTIVFEPKWDPATMATDEIKDMLGIW